jgi:TRAP-type C4-dicarboxylate transport system permease large subunit
VDRVHRAGEIAVGRARKESVTAASFFEWFRLLLWALAAAVIGFYIYGLVLGIYSPLELGLLSVVSLSLIVLFTIHEVRLRRELREGKYHDEYAREGHDARERRGF